VRALGRLTEQALGLAAVLLLLGLLAAVVIGVAARQLGRPVAWSDELAQNLLVWTGFVGLMIAARRGAHIRIGAVVDRLPRLLRVPLEVLIRLVVLAFAAALLWHGTPLVPRNWDIGWVSLPLPSGLLYLPIPVAALAVAAQALGEIVRLVGLARGDEGLPP
jgi:TRAP-type C4-dicarboxylate transport system permease small subunit